MMEGRKEGRDQSPHPLLQNLTHLARPDLIKARSAYFFTSHFSILILIFNSNVVWGRVWFLAWPNHRLLHSFSAFAFCVSTSVGFYNSRYIPQESSSVYLFHVCISFIFDLHFCSSLLLLTSVLLLSFPSSQNSPGKFCYSFIHDSYTGIYITQMR